MLKLAMGLVEFLKWKKYILEEDVIETPVSWFDLMYEVEWLDNEYSRKLIKEIDKSDYIKGHIIESPFLGAIPPRMLSGGVKCLISAINNPDLYIRFNSCGDNCIKSIADISKKYDCKAYVEFLPSFNEADEMDVLLVNTGERFYRGEDLFYAMMDYWSIMDEEMKEMPEEI